MDDMYQYAASAVNSNNKEQVPAAVSEEDDVIIKAFNNIGWGKKWSSLVDTVKKQVLLYKSSHTCLSSCMLMIKIE